MQNEPSNERDHRGHAEPAPRCSLREAAERLAAECLARHGVWRPPVDIDAVAAAEGLRFVPIDFAECLGAYSSGAAGARTSWGRRPFAVIGSHQHPLRQRFTKAHELAHHLLDEPTGWVARMQLHPPVPRGYKGDVYHEAHELFAASLLMPRPWVLSLVDRSRPMRHADVARIAQRFAVTKIAAGARIHELGIEAVGDGVLLSRSRGRQASLYGAA